MKVKLIKSIKPIKPARPMSKKQIEQALIDNFIALQKVLTNLAVKFDALSDNISKLLQLFEISAKSFIEKHGEAEKKDVEKDKEFLDKLNSLLDQNKTIAKGLTLMEEKIRERISTSEIPPREMPYTQAFTPTFMPRRLTSEIPEEEREKNERERIKSRPLPRI